MRWSLLAAMFAACACAQSPIDPGQIPALLGGISQRPASHAFRCGFSPVEPSLDFSLRFNAGYTFRLQADRYQAGRHVWMVVTKVTPQDGSSEPSWFFARTGTDLAGTAGTTIQISGRYLLGRGSYTVESTLYDELGGSCKKEWRVNASLAHGQGDAQLALPPFAVRGVASPPTGDREPAASGPPLTILLDAAPVAPLRDLLDYGDRDALMVCLSAIVGRVPTSSVRLVIFNLDKQKEIFRRDGFSVDAIREAFKALGSIQLASVDVSVLEKPLGYIDFLAGLIERELRGPAPAPTVILLGPLSRHGGQFPEGTLNPSAATRFFYLQYEPQRPNQFSRPAVGVVPSHTTYVYTNGQAQGTTGPQTASPIRNDGTVPTLPRPRLSTTDIINAAMTSLKGTTLVIRTPEDLAKAIAVVQKTR
jgi:hypothetical protein